MTKQIAIEFETIFYEKDGLVILNDISGRIESGKITALIGPSGSGKTTLLKMFNGLISPTRGTINVLGQPITSYNPVTLRCLVGIALQEAPIIRGTVFENLALPRTLKNEKLLVEEAIHYLTIVGLNESFLKKPAQELSGGQRQRLSIARTLINQPKILLLDEITSALDPTASAEIESLIKKITQQFGVATVWITHNSMQALNVSDYLLLLNAGEIELAGDTSSIIKENNEHLQAFIHGGTK